MSAKKLLNIFQDRRIKGTGKFVMELLMILSLIYASLLSVGEEICFIYANF